jgi:hypothetical protein
MLLLSPSHVLFHTTASNNTHDKGQWKCDDGLHA